jgi:hypothetical protein
MRNICGRLLAAWCLLTLLIPVMSRATDCVFVPGQSICGLPLTATRRQFVGTLGMPDGQIKMGTSRIGYFYGQRLILIFSHDVLIEADAWETNPNIDFWHEVSNGEGRDSMRLVFPGWSPWAISRKEFAKHNNQFPIEDADESAENRSADGLEMTIFYDYCYRAQQQCGAPDDYEAFQVNRITLFFRSRAK